MKEFALEREQVVPRGIDEVFAFFADPHNLAAITPPWLAFRLRSASTAVIGEGTLLEYRLRVRGVPLRWRSRIRAWRPPLGFVDEQVSGPYRRWVHEHAFEDLGPCTRVRDRVSYGVPGGSLVERWLVRPDLERIFAYRQRRLAELLAPGASDGAAAGDRDGARARR